MWRHGDNTYPTTPTSLVDYFKSRLLNFPPATEVEEVVPGICFSIISEYCHSAERSPANQGWLRKGLCLYSRPSLTPSMNELCHRLTQRNINKFPRPQWVRNNQFPQIFTFSHVVAAKKGNMELCPQFIWQQEGGLRKELLRTTT